MAIQANENNASALASESESTAPRSVPSKNVSPKKSKILRRSLLVLLGLLLGFNIYLLNARTVGNNQLPMPFGIGIAVVQSGSMEPTFAKGALLFAVKKDSYRVGDIVVYQSKGILVVHRIIAKNGTTIVTKGDANNVADDPFDVSAVKGTAVVWVPGVGYLIDFFKSPFGILLLIACAVLLVELSFRRDKKQKQFDEKALHKKYLEEEIRRLKQEMYGQQK